MGKGELRYDYTYLVTACSYALTIKRLTYKENNTVSVNAAIVSFDIEPCPGVIRPLTRPYIQLQFKRAPLRAWPQLRSSTDSETKTSCSRVFITAKITDLGPVVVATRVNDHVRFIDLQVKIKVKKK